MLLIVTSLRLTLDGALPLRPRPDARIPPAAPAAEPAVPESRDEHPLFQQIRDVYGTTYVPSMYRSWPRLACSRTRGRRSGRSWGVPPAPTWPAPSRAAAEEAARSFPEVAFFDADRARPIIDQFSIALPRNLVFAVAAAGSV